MAGRVVAEQVLKKRTSLETPSCQGPLPLSPSPPSVKLEQMG